MENGIFTYEAVGKLLGMSKARVRQIEHAAMNKLREKFSATIPDLSN